MIVRIAEDVIWRDLGEEVVILNLATSTYFGLSGAGGQMWRQFAEHGSSERALDALQQLFEVQEDVLRADMDALLRDLESRELIVLDKAVLADDRSGKGLARPAKPASRKKQSKPRSARPARKKSAKKPLPAKARKKRKKRS